MMKKRFTFFSDLKEMKKTLIETKEEFKIMNESLDFIKKLTIIISVLIITSSVIILAK